MAPEPRPQRSRWRHFCRECHIEVTFPDATSRKCYAVAELVGITGGCSLYMQREEVAFPAVK